jgi:hypothetical protein
LGVGEHEQMSGKLARGLMGGEGRSVAAVHGEAERRRVEFAGARVGKPVWRLKGLIERLQSFTGS